MLIKDSIATFFRKIGFGFLFLLCFVAIAAGTEIVRSFQSNHQYLILEEICLRGRQWQVLSPKFTYRCLVKTSDLVFQSVSLNYSFIVITNKHYLSELLPLTVPNETVFIDYLRTIKISDYLNSEEADLSRFFYNFSLDAYAQGDLIQTEKYLTASTLLNPELSYYHRELANLLLVLGKEEEAVDKIHYCERFEFPYKDCQQFKSQLLYHQLEAVGFLHDSINTYYTNIY